MHQTILHRPLQRCYSSIPNQYPLLTHCSCWETKCKATVTESRSGHATWRRRRYKRKRLSSPVSQPSAKVIKFTPREDPEIIHDIDHHVQMVYKPPRWTLTTCRKMRGGNRLQQWLVDKMGKQFPFLAKEKLSHGLVHRLDVETSGPIIVSTNQPSWNAMRDIISSKSVYKEYRTLMHGALPDSMQEGTIKHRLSTSNANGPSFTLLPNS